MRVRYCWLFVHSFGIQCIEIQRSIAVKHPTNWNRIYLVYLCACWSFSLLLCLLAYFFLVLSSLLIQNWSIPPIRRNEYSKKCQLWKEQQHSQKKEKSTNDKTELHFSYEQQQQLLSTCHSMLMLLRALTPFVTFILIKFSFFFRPLQIA